MNWIAIHTVYALLISVVSGQECTDTIGSLNYNSIFVTVDRTFILAGYIVPCNSTVVAWEFCYRISALSVTFYPGVWRVTGTNDNRHYVLVQSNNITYNASIRTNGTSNDQCQRVNLSVIDQFTAPAGSVVGLYSNIQTQLLRTNTDSSITTYQFSGNQSSVTVNPGAIPRAEVNYNIAIRVHLDVQNVSTTVSTTMSTPVFTIMSITVSTPVSSTVSTPMPVLSTLPLTTISSVMPTMVTLEPTTSISSSISTNTTVRPSGSERSSSSVAIVIGCIVGILVCVIIVVLLILLVLYLKKRMKSKGTLDLVHSELDSVDSNKFRDHQYSLMKQSGMNGVIGNKGIESHYETADQYGYCSSEDSTTSSDKPNEVVYINSNSTTCEYHPKAASGNYESIPRMNNCKIPHYEMSDRPYQYEEAIPSTIRDNMEYSTVGEVLSDDELMYEDPGHKKEKIYAWFEKKKFRKIEGKSVRILQALGSGEFGTVHLGLWSNGSDVPLQVAVKTLNSKCSESDRVKFLREAAIMGQFVHNNVVQLHGVVTEEENMMIVLEYMPKGDLRNFLVHLKTETPIEVHSKLKRDLLSFCRQIAAGMNYLANKQFVHRDLAARNVLVSSDDVCKIADFGLARDVGDDIYYIASGGKIPLKWTAPEAIFYKKYSTQSDVWSFGCVMYEIWSLGRKPAEGIEEYLEKLTTGYRLPPPPGCPRAIYELMIECWHPTAKSRPLPGSVLRTLQKSDRALLTNSVQVTDDDVTKDSQSMMLGAPLTAGSHLYLDLQQRYKSYS